MSLKDQIAAMAQQATADLEKEKAKAASSAGEARARSAEIAKAFAQQLFSDKTVARIYDLYVKSARNSDAVVVISREGAAIQKASATGAPFLRGPVDVPSLRAAFDSADIRGRTANLNMEGVNITVRGATAPFDDIVIDFNYSGALQ